MEKKILKDAWKQGFFKFLAPDNKIATNRAVYLCPDDSKYYAVYNGLQINVIKSTNLLYDYEYYDFVTGKGPQSPVEKMLNEAVKILIEEPVKQEGFIKEVPGTIEPVEDVSELKIRESLIKEESTFPREYVEKVEPVLENINKVEYVKKYVFKDAWKLGTFSIFIKSQLYKRAVYKDDEGDIFCSHDGNIALLSEAIDSNYSYKLKELLITKNEKELLEEKKSIEELDEIDENCISPGKLGQNVYKLIEEDLNHEVYNYYPIQRKEEHKRIWDILIDIFVSNTHFYYSPLRNNKEDIFEITFINVKTLYAHCYNCTVGKNLKISLGFDDIIEIVRKVVRFNKKYNKLYFADYPFKDRVLPLENLKK